MLIIFETIYFYKCDPSAPPLITITSQDIAINEHDSSVSNMATDGYDPSVATDGYDPSASNIVTDGYDPSASNIATDGYDPSVINTSYTALPAPVATPLVQVPALATPPIPIGAPIIRGCYCCYTGGFCHKYAYHDIEHIN